MQSTPVGVIGASGYSGIEATRLLAGHPHVELKFVASDRWAGDTVGRRTGLASAHAKMKYAPQERAVDLARECAVVLLATPAEASLELVPKLLDAGVKVIDLSGAYRIKDAAVFKKYYKLDHTSFPLVSEAFYGIPELFRTPKGTRLVTNPGCYPTAAALALAPLVPLLEPGVIVDAASGTTGAGRKGSEEMSFAEVDEDFRAYKTLKHQHQPEMAQTLGTPVVFTAHLLPSKRGILATCYGRLKSGVSPDALKAAYMHKYAESPFLEIANSPDEVALKDVTGTNKCKLAVACEGSQVVAISAIDNLVKGAAGQAVQNLNLMMGWPETSGLDALRGFHP